MKTKQLVLLIAGVFFAGLISGAVIYKGVNTSKDLFKKISKKVDDVRLKFTPLKKEAQMLCDFENKNDFAIWQKSHAKLASTKKGVTSGRSAAQIDFDPSEQASGILTTNLFKKNKKKANWEGYESLSLDIYNPQEKSVRLIVRLKDNKGKKHKADFHLKPQKTNRLLINVDQIRNHLNPSRIKQMNIFFWEPKQKHTLFVDNIQLLPRRFVDDTGAAILRNDYMPRRGEKIYAKDGYFEFTDKKAKWLKGNVVNVPLNISNPTSGDLSEFPVSGGIPFPKGQIHDFKSIRFVDQQNNELPMQIRALGYWNDKSIKWAQVDTKVSLISNRNQNFNMQYGELKASKSSSRLKVIENNNEVTVSTGPMKFIVGKGGFRLFDKVWLDHNQDGRFSNEEIVSTGSDLVLMHFGKDYRSSLDKKYTLTIEELGPVKTTLKAEGWFVSDKSKKFCKFITRIQAFEGEDFVRVYHTFIYTGYPENKQHYLYRDKKLPKNETIDEMYIETALNAQGPFEYSFGADGNSLKSPLNETVSLYQKSSESFAVKTKNQDILNGQKLGGWVDISTASHGLAIVVKNLWQQFPKGWTMHPGTKKIVTSIWPKEAGILDFKTSKAAKGKSAAGRGSAFGIGKTHEISFYFHSQPLSKERGWNVVKLLGRSLPLSADPKWIYDTTAIGKVRQYEGGRLQPAENSAEAIFDWADRQIKDNKWYGMIDFGDTLSIYRKKDDHFGWHPDGRWGWMNNEAMGLHSGSLKQFLRTGKYKYFELGENVAHHIMDVDTIHYNTVANDKRIKGVIPDDYAQVGSQHRHNVQHWGGRNEETSHTNLHGILLYYYMTGYERAFDVAKEIGEFFLKERVTYYKHPDNCPQRNVSNLVWGTIEMYEATGDERYRKMADKWADILFKGQSRDGSWPEKYNPVAKRWEGEPKAIFALQYTLPALVAYHQVTGNKAIAEAIIKGTEYFIEHKPYNPFFEALQYSYYLTGKQRYIEIAHERLDYFTSHQRWDKDPVINGMIYSKPYYLRPIEFLYQYPHAFDLINEKVNSRTVKYNE